jgi:hypothetical protein
MPNLAVSKSLTRSDGLVPEPAKGGGCQACHEGHSLRGGGGLLLWLRSEGAADTAHRRLDAFRIRGGFHAGFHALERMGVPYGGNTAGEGGGFHAAGSLRSQEGGDNLRCGRYRLNPSRAAPVRENAEIGLIGVAAFWCLARSQGPDLAHQERRAVSGEARGGQAIQVGAHGFHVRVVDPPLRSIRVHTLPVPFFQHHQ